MDWTYLLRPDIREFMERHRDADIPALALAKPPDPGWPYRIIIDQLKSRQKAAVKAPRWLAKPGIVFPAADIMEQASSEAAASYKSKLSYGKTFVDLTGGSGIDCAAFMENFESGDCVEQDETAASLLAHNLKILVQKPLRVHHTTAEKFLEEMKDADTVFIDPQRRSIKGKGLYRLADCSPDVAALLPKLRMKCRTLIIKTSPMLDIAETLRTLENVAAVHVVEWNGECKEVLYILDFSKITDDVSITAVRIDDTGNPLNQFTFRRSEEAAALAQTGTPQKYLYEPGPAFQKAGGFNMLAQVYNLLKLHPHTHLYTGDMLCPDFPGRAFEIIETLPVKKEALGFKQANLAIRNFPGSVDALRKKLGLRDGGQDYIFACTLADESKKLIHCRKTA